MSIEAHRSFGCFGGTATIHVRATSTARGEASADEACSRLLDAHNRLSRFIHDSELTLLNQDARREVPATPLLRALARAVRTAGSQSNGLVDATLLDRLERIGYRQSLGERRPISLSEALSSRIDRAPGKPHPAQDWRSVSVDDAAETITRPPGVRIDSGGIAKGLLADLLAADLGGQRAFAIDCCGDIRIGGRAHLSRKVVVEDPFGGPPIHELKLRNGAVATSGIGRRCWVGPDDRPAHHILDPSTGKPAFTGIAQATALAPSALLAETYAKAALLSGPEHATEWLPHGGIIVRDGGEVEFLVGDRPLQRIAAAA